MNISEILKKERIKLNMPDSTKEQALNSLIDLLYESGALLDREAFLADVLEREKISTTGIGNTVAIPHGKSASVKETTVAVGQLSNGVEWESMDNKPVKIIVLLAVNEKDKNGVHLKLLSQMARKLASEEICLKLAEAKNEDEIINIFSE